VAGSTVTITAEGLEEGEEYDIIVRSTPQLLGDGVVPAGGSVTRTVTLPALEPGWHSITFSSTWAGGGAAVGRVWFLVSEAGTLVRFADPLPVTGAEPGPVLVLGGFLLVGGLVLLGVRRRIRLT